jgi:hypothetical protein
MRKQFALLISFLLISVGNLHAQTRQGFAQANLLSGTSINFEGEAEDENMTFSLPLIDFDSNFDVNSVALDDAKVKVLETGRNRSLQVSLGHVGERPSATMRLPDHIDLSEYVTIMMDITNHGSKSISIEAQCFSDTDRSLTYDDGALFYYRSMLVLNPGETDVMMIFLSRWMDSLPKHVQPHLSGMYGIPGGFVRRRVNLDLSQINHVSIFKQKTDDDWTVSVDNIRVVGKLSLPDEETLQSRFFPFVDQFGQYMHSDWPNKVKTPEDIKKQQREEDEDLTKNPDPADWNQYGGWASGPSLRATGHFRVEKYNGKWWFVDPEGKLFWSHGVNGPTISQRTQISGREKYFSYIPPNDDFYGSNLRIKYPDTETYVSEVTNYNRKRLRSWGINTGGGKNIPYTLFIMTLPFGGGITEDFDAEAYRKSLKERLDANTRLKEAANDPWCIGYYVDNESTWPERNQEVAIHQYFKTVREVMDEYAPNKLYLGCRSNSPNFNRIAFEAGAKYCDVLSINHYDYNFTDFKETEGLDKPVIVGEFHFGALDRGLPHPSLRSASSQKQRARIYRHFVNQALESDYVVGTTWFQWGDQVCTSRGMDGENYQIGFVDICDRPYPEMVDALRKIRSYMYDYRLNGNRDFEY